MLKNILTNNISKKILTNFLILVELSKSDSNNTNIEQINIEIDLIKTITEKKLSKISFSFFLWSSFINE